MNIPKDWPDEGFVRLVQVIGDPQAVPPVPAVFPVSESTWYRGVKAGRYPKPVKGGPNCSLYPVASLRAAFEKIEQQVQHPKAA